MQMAQNKIQYVGNEDDPVRLFQYIFSYENSGNFALFNFHNQYNEDLRSFSFIVKQYDKESNLLVKSKMDYDKLSAKSDSFFVPKIKLSLDSLCDYISVEVVEALFIDSYYFEGKMTVKQQEVEEEKIDISTLPYFHNRKRLLFQKPILAFLCTVFFIIISFLCLYLYLT